MTFNMAKAEQAARPSTSASEAAAWACMSWSEPAFVVSDEVGRLLLDALGRHYGGTGDFRTLRADFLHERERVDKLMEYLNRLAYRGAP